MVSAVETRPVLVGGGTATVTWYGCRGGETSEGYCASGERWKLNNSCSASIGGGRVGHGIRVEGNLAWTKWAMRWTMQRLRSIYTAITQDRGGDILLRPGWSAESLGSVGFTRKMRGFRRAPRSQAGVPGDRGSPQVDLCERRSGGNTGPRKCRRQSGYESQSTWKPGEPHDWLQGATNLQPVARRKPSKL